MSEAKIEILLQKWKELKQTNSVEAGFERRRLSTIERIIDTFIEYYNENKYSAPYFLRIEHLPNSYVTESRLSLEGQGLNKALNSQIDISMSHKAKELFERYYHMLIEHTLSNDISLPSKWIKDKAMELTRDHVHGLYEVGNSPWDPR